MEENEELQLDGLTEWLRANIDAIVDAKTDGVRCHHCTSRVALERRAVTKEMSRFLVRLVRLYETEAKMYSTRQVMAVTGGKASSDAAFFTYWGIVVKGNPAHRDMQGTYYAPTPLGIAFAHGEVSVPAYKLILKKQVLFTSERRVDIWEALEVPHGFEHLLGEGPA